MCILYVSIVRHYGLYGLFIFLNLVFCKVESQYLDKSHHSNLSSILNLEYFTRLCSFCQLISWLKTNKYSCTFSYFNKSAEGYDVTYSFIKKQKVVFGSKKELLDCSSNLNLFQNHSILTVQYFLYIFYNIFTVKYVKN